jgi:hypothetical protein
VRLCRDVSFPSVTHGYVSESGKILESVDCSHGFLDDYQSRYQQL